MKIRSLATTVLLVASLGACSSTESYDGSQEATVTPTTENTEDADSSSPESSDSPNEGEESTRRAAETDVPSNEDLDLDYGVNEHGNIPMNFDEGGYVTHIHYQKPLVQFQIQSIEPNFTCTNPSASEPENCNFMAIRMRVETQPELAETPIPELEFSTYDFRIMGPEGSIQNNPTGNANDCITDDEKLPETIGAGEYFSGMIILDSEHESGALIFAPRQFGDRWEWTF